MTKRRQMTPAVFLILPRQAEKWVEILFIRRFNTGHEDGMLSLPAGHVEDYEALTEAVVREAREEIGIAIPHEYLELVHTQVNRRTDSGSDYINFYFLLPLVEGKMMYAGEPRICEPDQCSELVWARFDRYTDLPANVVSYVSIALAVSLQKFGPRRYSETFYASPGVVSRA